MQFSEEEGLSKKSGVRSTCGYTTWIPRAMQPLATCIFSLELSVVGVGTTKKWSQVFLGRYDPDNPLEWCALKAVILPDQNQLLPPTYSD